MTLDGVDVVGVAACVSGTSSGELGTFGTDVYSSTYCPSPSDMVPMDRYAGGVVTFTSAVPVAYGYRMARASLALSCAVPTVPGVQRATLL